MFRLLSDSSLLLFSCGRSHCAALDTDSQIWTCVSWGRPFQLSTPLLDKSSPETTAAQIISGWSFSAVLTDSSDVLVYWPFSGAMKTAIATKTEELDQQSSTKAYPTEQEPHVVPCYTWTMQGVDPVRLPSIPVRNLPELHGTGSAIEGETKLVKIAGADNTIIGLTNKGHVLIYHTLGNETRNPQQSWVYVS